MKTIYQELQLKLTCQVCGGEGICADGPTMRAAYTGGFISHTDPRICARNLKNKKKQI